MEILLLEENKSFLELLSFELQLIVLFIKKKKTQQILITVTQNVYFSRCLLLFLQSP